jgi:hypothetical protein
MRLRIRASGQRPALSRACLRLYFRRRVLLFQQFDPPEKTTSLAVNPEH